MFSVVKGAVDFMTASRNAGTPDTMMKALATDRVNNIITMLGKTQITVEECTNAITMIGTQNVFDGELKAKLLTAFHTKIQAGVDENCADRVAKAQRNVFVEHYMTAELYDTLQDKSLPEDVRVDATSSTSCWA